MLDRMASEITEENLQALRIFAKANGRYWKRALRDEWMKACSGVARTVRVYVDDESFATKEIEYRQNLQWLRNHPAFGTRGLEKYRLPKDFKFHGQP